MELGFYDIANHGLMYAVVIVGILSVATFAFLSMRKSWSRALEIGISKDKLMNVVKATVSYTIVPSIAIVVGLFSIAAMLGLAWPWWRLSVVGSVTYEITAAQMALDAAGVDLATATGTDFVQVMYVMTIGIMGGLVVAPFISERIHNGAMKIKDRDARWGALGNSVFMLSIIIVFAVPMVLDGGVKLLTLLTSMVLALALNFAAEKFKLAWLRSFVLAIALLGAMAASVLWTHLLG